MFVGENLNWRKRQDFYVLILTSWPIDAGSASVKPLDERPRLSTGVSRGKKVRHIIMYGYTRMITLRCLPSVIFEPMKSGIAPPRFGLRSSHISSTYENANVTAKLYQTSVSECLIIHKDERGNRTY